MSLPDPITRKETLLNAAATGQTTGLPSPITREETYLKAIAENGGGSGGGSVSSVNGKTGDVVLDASDVGALPSGTTIPTKTSDLNNDSNFVADASYVHTDNNYDATAKGVVDGVGTALGGKADKVSSATSGNFAGLDSNGNITDSGSKASDFLTSHQDISGKADKVTGATSGNFAGLDANGNLTDSGSKASDFAAASALSAKQPKTLDTPLTIGGSSVTTVEGALGALNTIATDVTFYLEQTVTLSTSATVAATFSNAKITANSLIDVAVSEWGTVPEDVTVSAGSCTVTMPITETAHSVTVRIYVR